MAIPVRFQGLRFACECVSREDGHTDPWASIAKEKLLNDGTKEEILNLVAQGSKTISQLAEALGLSAASIHKHVSEMTHSELLRPSTKRERKHPAERYYEPNFPIIDADDGAQFEALCHDMAAQFADLFEKRCPRLKLASNHTGLTNRGWTFSDVAHYLYAKTQRGARELLEQRGILPPRKKHRNGAKWIFWAEQPKADADSLHRPDSTDL